METVQADFEFFDPKPGDFHGVKLLLHNYLDNKEWDLSGFVDLIVGQSTVGTVVKLGNGDDDEEEDDSEGGDGNDEDLYAFITALNLNRYGSHSCIAALKEYLLQVCNDNAVKKKMELLLEEQASNVGLLVSKRFVNLPHQLIPPLYDAIFDEISWATEDEPTQELRESFRFKFYLLITRIYMQKTVNQRKVTPRYDYDEPFIYFNAEDEIFHELSELSFTFCLHDKQLLPHELKDYTAMGLVMLVKADEVSKFREKLKSLPAYS